MKMICAPGQVIAVTVVTLILGFSLGGGEARGQSTGATATPTISPTATPVILPTATPTPSVPSGRDLLRQATAAITAKNTVHITIHLKLEAPSVDRLVVNGQGDFSIKPRLEHSVLTERTTRLDRKPAKTTTQREENIIVRKRQATKTGTKPWKCSTAPKASTTDLTGGPASIAGTSRSVTNLGSETIGTVPVWHVRDVEKLDISGQSAPITADYYISQADFTLVRLSESYSDTIQGTTAKWTIAGDYTRYGETVKVNLPAACKGS